MDSIGFLGEYAWLNVGSLVVNDMFLLLYEP